MSTWFKLTALALPILGAATACGPASECVESFKIELDPPISDSGHYVVRVSSPGFKETCEFDLPPQTSGDRPHCTPNLWLDAAADQAQWPVAHLGASPADLVFEIEHDGSVVFSMVLSPDYRVVENGGGECRQANMTVRWQ